MLSRFSLLIFDDAAAAAAAALRFSLFAIAFISITLTAIFSPRQLFSFAELAAVDIIFFHFA
jgi:hypothetical protein